MSTAPGSASRQFRSKKKKGSSSRPPSSDLSPQKLHKSFTATSSHAGTKTQKPKIATSHAYKGNKAEEPKIATSHASKGPVPIHIVGGDPFVPGTKNYEKMVADRRRLYERGKTGVFSVCYEDPCSPDNFLKNKVANCPALAAFVDSWP